MHFHGKYSFYVLKPHYITYKTKKNPANLDVKTNRKL